MNIAVSFSFQIVHFNQHRARIDSSVLEMCAAFILFKKIQNTSCFTMMKEENDRECESGYKQRRAGFYR